MRWATYWTRPSLTSCRIRTELTQKLGLFYIANNNSLIAEAQLVAEDVCLTELLPTTGLQAPLPLGGNPLVPGELSEFWPFGYIHAAEEWT